MFPSGEEKQRLQVSPDEAVGMGKCRRANQTWASHVIGQGTHLAFSSWCYTGSGGKNQERCQLLIKPGPFEANCYGGYCLFPQRAARDSSLISWTGTL